MVQRLSRPISSTNGIYPGGENRKAAKRQNQQKKAGRRSAGMTRQEIVQSLHDILLKMKLPSIAAFHEDARLNEDLYMDSIMILQLILHLEVDLGFDIPDEMLVSKDFRTVGSLADFLLHQQKPAAAEGIL